jgi:hypothetical protein
LDPLVDVAPSLNQFRKILGDGQSPKTTFSDSCPKRVKTILLQVLGKSVVMSACPTEDLVLFDRHTAMHFSTLEVRIIA